MSRYRVPIPSDTLYSGSDCAHQSQISGPLYTPPYWRNTTGTLTSQSPSAHLSLDWRSSLSFRSQFHLFQCSSAVIGTPKSPLSGMALLYFIPYSIRPYTRYSAWDGNSSILTGDPWSQLLLLYCIPHSLPPPPTPFQLSSTGIALLNSHGCSSAWMCAPPFDSALLTPTFGTAPLA